MHWWPHRMRVVVKLLSIATALVTTHSLQYSVLSHSAWSLRGMHTYACVGDIVLSTLCTCQEYKDSQHSCKSIYFRIKLCLSVFVVTMIWTEIRDIVFLDRILSQINNQSVRILAPPPLDDILLLQGGGGFYEVWKVFIRHRCVCVFFTWVWKDSKVPSVALVPDWSFSGKENICGNSERRTEGRRGIEEEKFQVIPHPWCEKDYSGSTRFFVLE